MHRPVRLLVAAVAVTAVTISVGVGPVTAAPDRRHAGAESRKALSCPLQVLGVTADLHLTARVMDKAVVTGEKQSGSALPFDPTALGYYSAMNITDGVRLRLDAVADDGQPRVVTVTDKVGRSTLGVTVAAMQQASFRPRLFADSIDYRVYTVSRSGALQRWFLTKEPNGDLHFTDRLKLGTGFDTLTALQVASRQKWGGAWRDVLLATTSTGRLKEIVIPLATPKRLRTYTLAKTGYAGTTGLSLSYCQGKVSFSSVIAVDADAGTATWTTVKGTQHPKKAVTRLRGPAGVGEDWALHAIW
ncbi:MAG: hypothetical protein R2731_03880 [Nocardioides sp.]